MRELQCGPGLPSAGSVKWVDTHCHLQLDGRNPAELLDRAVQVDWVVVPGVDAASSRAALDLAAQYPGKVFATCGLHPHDADQWPSEAGSLRELAPSSVAIGETGLDFYRELSPRDEQIVSFNEHVRLATELDKPLIVHCRDAFSDIYDILEKSGEGGRAVLHSWTGGTRWTKRFLELGVMFSFSGMIGFDTAETIRLGAELVPDDRALVETDTPYLAPPPHRGERNEPAWVSHVGEALARIWGRSPEDVARVTTENALRIFR